MRMLAQGAGLAALAALALPAPSVATTPRALVILPPGEGNTITGPGFAQYQLLPLNWWVIGSACVALLLYLAVRTWQLCRAE